MSEVLPVEVLGVGFRGRLCAPLEKRFLLPPARSRPVPLVSDLRFKIYVESLAFGFYGFW
jgi:hypothetical protein